MSTHIIGSDEVGYGALAGSLIICAVKAPADWKMEGLNDSKKLTPKRRTKLRDQLYEEAAKNNIKYYIAERTHTQIDEGGVYNVLKDAHIEAIRALYSEGDRVIVDGNLKFDGLGADDLGIESVIKADGSVMVVSAGSIIAKVFRDEMLIRLHKDYPLYDFDNSKGYPSPRHLEALKKYSYTDLHRKSYRPVKDMIEKENK